MPRACHIWSLYRVVIQWRFALFIKPVCLPGFALPCIEGGFLKSPIVYVTIEHNWKATRPNPHLEVSSSHSNCGQFPQLRASQRLSKVLALRISLTDGPEHDFFLVNSHWCQEIRLCLFVMLTNNLFNGPFYIFQEDLGQDELPKFLEISLPLFLELGYLLTSCLLASPRAQGSYWESLWSSSGTFLHIPNVILLIQHPISLP